MIINELTASEFKDRKKSIKKDAPKLAKKFVKKWKDYKVKITKDTKVSPEDEVRYFKMFINDTFGDTAVGVKDINDIHSPKDFAKYISQKTLGFLDAKYNNVTPLRAPKPKPKPKHEPVAKQEPRLSKPGGYEPPRANIAPPPEYTPPRANLRPHTGAKTVHNGEELTYLGGMWARPGKTAGKWNTNVPNQKEITKAYKNPEKPIEKPKPKPVEPKVDTPVEKPKPVQKKRMSNKPKLVPTQRPEPEAPKAEEPRVQGVNREFDTGYSKFKHFDDKWHRKTDQGWDDNVDQEDVEQAYQMNSNIKPSVPRVTKPTTTSSSVKSDEEIFDTGWNTYKKIGGKWSVQNDTGWSDHGLDQEDIEQAYQQEQKKTEGLIPESGYGWVREQIIDEGVKLKSAMELYAYAVVVAEAYDAAPVSDPAAKRGYDALTNSNSKLNKQVGSDVDVKPTRDDPYNKPEQIAQDVMKNKSMSIYNEPNNHPSMSNDQNVDFRTVHDYFAHVGPNRKNAGKEFKSHNFTLRGEYNAYSTHAKMAPKEAIPILFTEVVGQISYYNVTGNYATQKAAILPGFDYINIGIMDGEKKQRYQKILKALQSDQVQKFKVDINGGLVIDKSKIKWKGISKGK